MFSLKPRVRLQRFRNSDNYHVEVRIDGLRYSYMALRSESTDDRIVDLAAGSRLGCVDSYLSRRVLRLAEPFVKAAMMTDPNCGERRR